MRHHSIIRRGLTALTITGALLGATLAGSVGSATATPPATDSATAAGYAGGWLAAQVTADGSVHVAGSPSPGRTLQTALSLATAGVGQSAFNSAVGWLGTHVDDVTGSGATFDAGADGSLLLVVDAAGLDPTNFGGVNLVTRLSSSISTFNSTTDTGLYGPMDPTYDGTYRQGVAILGLDSAGASIPTSAITWLTDRQCGTTNPLVRGSWQAYRLVANACDPGDPTMYSGVDTNDTALATSALAAIGVEPTYDPTAYLAAAQNSTGGWGFVAGAPDDPNSTSVVIQALSALHVDLVSPPYARSEGVGPFTALLAFQIGCDADPADQGSFTYSTTAPAPNNLATEQAIWGLTTRTFPLADVTWSTASLPCQPATTTTTAPGDTTTTAGGTAGAATPVSAAPAFTG